MWLTLVATGPYWGYADPKTLHKLGRIEVFIPASDWSTTVSSLADAVGTGFITFIPRKWKPVELRGDAVSVLNRICSAVGAIWGGNDAGFFIAEDTVPSFLTKKEQHEAMIAETNSLSDYALDYEKLIFSLSEPQMEALGRGQIIPAKDLHPNQLDLLRLIAPPLPVGFRDSLPAYIERGQLALGCFVKAGGAEIFWQGEMCSGSAIPEFPSGAPFLPPSKPLSYSLEVIANQTNKLLGKSAHIFVACPERVKLGALEQSLPLPEGERVMVFRAYKDTEILITGWEWSLGAVLTCLQFVTRTQIRRVNRTIFLAPSTSFPWLGQEDEIAELEVSWARIRRLLTRCANNPRNRLLPFSLNQLLEPRLVQFRDLSDEQKEWVCREGSVNIRAVPDAIKESDELECYIFPYVVFEFWTGDGEKVKTIGFSPRMNYAWLAARTSALLREQHDAY